MTSLDGRLRPFDGAWLLARDLRDQPGLLSTRLAQHHIAAHRTWGVSAGLRVHNMRGLLEVTPGFAVDRCGRTGILPEPFRAHLADVGMEGRAFAVVLAVLGDGPRACVRLRDPRGVRARDIPLATVDAQGKTRSGDGHRQWLRRPGPARIFGGIVPKGAPLLAGPPHATRAAWSVHVDLAVHRLDAAPAVVVSAAGPASGSPPSVTLGIAGATAPQRITATTLEVTGVTPEGFDVTVRHHVAAMSTLLSMQSDARTEPQIRTAPMPIGWTALLPADRPSDPAAEEWS